MRNALFAGLTAALLSLGTITPAFAGQYSDSNKISDWSADHIEILTELGVIVGYEDGTFRPAENITREEMAVMLLEGMIALEAYIADSMWANDIYLYEELVAQQTQLLQALAAIDELQAKEAVENNNFVAISVSYTPDRDGDTTETSVELSAKIQIIELTDTFAVSIRPFVNSNTEFGGSVTLDADITSDLEAFAGIGVAYRADQDVMGALTGFDNNAVPYGHVGVSYDVSKNTTVIIDAKVPFNSEEGKEITINAGFGFKF